MHKNDDNIEQLMLSFLNDKLTLEDELYLKKWISESDANRDQAKRFCEFYHNIEAFSLLENIDTEQAFQQITAKIDHPKSNIRYIHILQRVAAILFIPLFGIQVYSLFVKNNSSPEWVTLRTNPGMVATVRLPDNSTVWLNSSTTIKYPQSFENERIVELDGEAFFDVTKNSKSRFKVSTPYQASIEVFGTRFNVDAYHGNRAIRTTLQEGQVVFHYQGKSNIEHLILKPSQTVVYDIENHELKPNDLNEETLTSWKDNQIVLKNTSLIDLLDIVEKRFDVKFVLKTAGLEAERFTGIFHSQQLITVLEHIKISSNIQYKIINESDQADHPLIVELYKM